MKVNQITLWSCRSKLYKIRSSFYLLIFTIVGSILLFNREINNYENNINKLPITKPFIPNTSIIINCKYDVG